MSTNSPKIDDAQELDLSAISKGIGNIFRNLNSFLYRCIRFVIKNIIILAVLFIMGAGLGTYLDGNSKRIYSHQIIVTPNFGSTDYLYSKIDLINSKIKERDTTFLHSIGIKNPENLMEIKIVPIVDIFKFVNNSSSEQNYKLLELMAQDGDLKKIAVEKTTSKNYPFHTITFSTHGMTTKEKTIMPLLDYLNDNAYYKSLQKESLNNINLKIQANDIIIAQIDDVLKEVSRKNDTGAKNDKLVYISENTQLNDIIKTKNDLINEQGSRRIDLVGLDKVIKDNSVITNIKDEDSFNGKMKIVLPLLFIFFFLFIYAFRSFYKTQKLKYN